MDQVIDYGASLARFIAAQNAASALGDEWEAVDVVGAGDHEDARLRAHHGDRPRRHRACCPACRRWSGKPYQRRKAEALGTARRRRGRDALPGAGRAGARLRGADHLYQDKAVGRVALGIPEQPLTAAWRTCRSA